MNRRGNWRNLSAALRPVGAVMVGVGVVIALCAVVGMVWDFVAPDPNLPEGGGLATLLAAVVSATLGFSVYFVGKRQKKHELSRREAILAVGLIWIGAGVCGGLPFLFGADMGPADALFEAISGLTTTGATVITDIETRLSRPLLLWRSMTQWLGGMGIVVLFVAVFPSLGAGGKHLYRGEAPGAQAEGFRPRIAETSIMLWKLYSFFTFVEFIVLMGLGMDPFEALCHALTTMSTGGFSTRDGSVGAFAVPAYEWTIATFMFIASVNYGLFYIAIRKRSAAPIYRSVEFRVYIIICVFAVLFLTAFNLHLHDDNWLTSLRYAYFMVATTISSTGYGADDYTLWSMPSFTLLLLMMFIGGCSGSTAGGIKIERIVMLAKQGLAQIRRSFEPSVVQVVRMGKKAVPNPILADVAVFFVIYMGCLAFGVLFLSIFESVPVPTAFGAMLTSLSNMGPAPFYDLHFAADNFSQYHPLTKVFFSFSMLLGRLEFFTLFALFVPGFWRR